MPRITSGTLTLTRTDISTLARKLAAATGRPHSENIALIAQGLGFADGNALMGALKNGEMPIAAPAPAKAVAGYRHDLQFSFVIDDREAIPDDLAEIAWLCSEGPAVGGKLEIASTALSRDELAEHAIRYGSTPDFFFGHEDEAEA